MEENITSIIINQKRTEDKLLFLNKNKDNLSIRKNETNEKKQIEYISVSKILASFSVVILHTNGVFWDFDYNNYKTYWISANLIESIFYFAVPLFILCIGATLLDFNERYGLIKYYKKRIIKIVIPLFCWTFILYYYKVYIIKNLKKEKITFEYLWNFYYMHKVYIIFGSLHSFLFMYMLIPLLAYVEKTKKLKIYSYCFLFLFFSQSLIPYLIKIFCKNLVWIYNINFGDIIYIFAGYIIQNYQFSKITKEIIYLFGFFGLLIHIYGTQILTLKYHQIILLHKGYINLPCILYSCSLFIFIKENSNLIFKLINKSSINNVGTLTLGPFFIHPPIIDLIFKYFNINKYSLTYRLFGGILIYLISLIITFFLKKIPLFKYLVP